MSSLRQLERELKNLDTDVGRFWTRLEALNRELRNTQVIGRCCYFSGSEVEYESGSIYHELRNLKATTAKVELILEHLGLCYEEPPHKPTLRECEKEQDGRAEN